MVETSRADRSELVLRPSKGKHAAYLLICLAFVAIGVLQISGRDGRAGGWLCTVFFGLGVVVFAAQLIPGVSYLRLGSEGFVFRSVFRKSPTILWREVSDFRVVGVPPSGHRMVVFDWHAVSDGGIRRANRYLTGASDGLPDSYGLNPQELADLLNTWRSRRTLSGATSGKREPEEREGRA